MLEFFTVLDSTVCKSAVILAFYPIKHTKNRCDRVANNYTYIRSYVSQRRHRSTDFISERIVTKLDTLVHKHHLLYEFEHGHHRSHVTPPPPIGGCFPETSSPLYRLHFLTDCHEISHTCSQTSSLVRVLKWVSQVTCNLP